MIIEQLLLLFQVKQGLKPLTDENHQREEALNSLSKLDLIYQHRNHWVVTSKGQDFIETLLKIGELL